MTEISQEDHQLRDEVADVAAWAVDTGLRTHSARFSPRGGSPAAAYFASTNALLARLVLAIERIEAKLDRRGEN